MSKYGIIFPSGFENKNKPDTTWELEAAAAEKVGFKTAFVSEGFFGEPVSINSIDTDICYIYRGWILKLVRYQEMINKVGNLFTTHKSYEWAYDFTQWYNSLQTLEEVTPTSLYVFKQDIEKNGLKQIALEVKKEFNNKSVFVKDFLKSRKHEWFDACFIRNASDIDETIRITNNLINLQGEDFYGGLVFRNFINLKNIGVHPKSKMPLPLEYRVFFINHQPIFCNEYWFDGATYLEGSEKPPTDWLLKIAKNIYSPFVALDIAQDENGKWWVIEVNDGGSAGLPDNVDVNKFYNILYQSLTLGK